MTDRLRRALVRTTIRAGVATPDLEPWAVEARWTNEHSRYLDLGPTRVHYRDEGRGADDRPTLLLVHGTFASLHTWDAWVERLAADYRVVRVDLPAHGPTGPHDGGYRIADLVTVLEGVRDALSLGEVAWRYALDYPDRTAALVLLDSIGYPLLASADRPCGCEPRASAGVPVGHAEVARPADPLGGVPRPGRVGRDDRRSVPRPAPTRGEPRGARARVRT
jgi:pimeloyl-ACP methyl ester carboxylesterase